MLTLLGAGVGALPTAAAAAGPAAGHGGGKAGPVTVIIAVIVLMGVVLSGLRTIAAASRVRRREDPSDPSA